MRSWIIALTILVAFAPSAIAHQTLQDQTALERLPTAESIGSAGPCSPPTATAVTDLAPAFRDVAAATYGGPNGARAYVADLLVAEGMTAVRDSWELSNHYFHHYDDHTDTEYGSEDTLKIGRCQRDVPMDGGHLAPTKRWGEDFPVGISLCAADPDMIILTYASGEVDGQTGYLASDRLVELVLEHRAMVGHPLRRKTPLRIVFATGGRAVTGIGSRCP